MFSSAIGKLAVRYGLKTGKNFAWGEIGGFTVTFIDDGIEGKPLCVSAAFPDGQAKENIRAALADPNLRKRHKILNAAVDDATVSVIFYAAANAEKHMEPFVDWFMPELARSGAAGADHCALCGQPLAGQIPSYRRIDRVTRALHAGCAAGAEQDAARQAQSFDIEAKNYGRGAAGALLGAAAGAVPWAVVYIFGWFVGYLGLLIGLGAKKGYELLGGRTGRAKFWIVLAATLLGVVLGNLLGDAIVLGKMVLGGEIPGATLMDIPAFIASAFTDMDYLRGWLGNFVLGVVFALLGIIGILRGIKSEVRGAVKKVESLD